MPIRPAVYEDLNAIMAIYDVARQYMRKNGNHSQWINGYPSRELVTEDIHRGVCYVEDDGGIRGVFALVLGDDPTYAYIEDGTWLDNEPYGTIHRIGSDGTRPGFLGRSLSFARSIIPNLRIDTHEANLPMRRLVEAHGFSRCGIIYVDDGSSRIAYQSHPTDIS